MLVAKCPFDQLSALMDAHGSAKDRVRVFSTILCGDWAVNPFVGWPIAVVQADEAQNIMNRRESAKISERKGTR